jgi:hypothetical protein
MSTLGAEVTRHTGAKSRMTSYGAFSINGPRMMALAATSRV